MIEVKSLSKRYGKGKNQFLALRNFNFGLLDDDLMTCGWFSESQDCQTLSNRSIAN